MTFMEPFYLVALLAGLLPVLLHMVHRHKAAEMSFSTLRFLQASVQRTRRRKYVEDLALLVVRALALALIAMGLAQPVVTNLGTLWGGDQARALAIIFDNSASMGGMEGGKLRFEKARQAAEQILDMLREGDAVAFLSTGGPLTPEQGKLLHTHETIRQALARCRLSYERADLAAKLHQARELLEKSAILQREIFIITDNQAVSWEGVKENPQAGSRPADIPMVLINVGGDPQANVALRNIRLESPAPAVGVPILAAVELVNGSPIPQQKNLELFLNGRKETTSPTLTISPLGALRHEFRFTLDRPGIHRGEVRLAEEDGNALDNRVFFALTVEQQVLVAIVKPRRPEIAFTDDAFYLERVLAPTGGEGWSIRTKVLTMEDLGRESLAGFAVVYCVNLPAPQPNVADKLREYVEGGGHLFWICGENVQPEAYNRMNEQARGKVLPANLNSLREAATAKVDNWKIAFLDKSHPALTGLSEPVSLYQSVLVHKYFPLAPFEGSQARVLAKLDDGQPLLVERGVGPGSVLMLATAAHVDWTNLPLRPIFLPLMARLTFRLAGLEAERAQVLAGAPLVVPLPGQTEETGIEVINPAGDVVRITDLKKDSRLFRFTQTHEVGPYLVRLTNTNPAKQFAYAVNIDPEECEVATIGSEELTRRLGPGLLVCQNPEELEGTVRRLREGRSLRDLILIALLVGLMVEAYLANCRARKPLLSPAEGKARG